MNCTEAKRYLDLFLDGELDVEQNLKVLEHLNLCGCCCKVFDGERWLADELKGRIRGEKAPEGLCLKVGAALDRECASHHRRRWAVLVAAAVAAAVVVALIVIPRRPQAPVRLDASELARLAVKEHDRERASVSGGGICVCAACSEHPEESLASFFAKNGEKTCTHPFDDKGLHWKSGAMWKDGIRGRLLCWTVQSTREHEALSHTALPSDLVRWDGGEERVIHGYRMRRFEVDGRVVLMGEDHGYI